MKLLNPLRIPQLVRLVLVIALTHAGSTANASHLICVVTNDVAVYQIGAPDDWDGGIYDSVSHQWTTPPAPGWVTIESVALLDSGPVDLSVPETLPWNHGGAIGCIGSSQVRYIASGAFMGLSSIRSIVVPECVESIGYAAFNGCSSLESMTLPFVGTSRGEPIDYENESASFWNLGENGVRTTRFCYVFGQDSYNNSYKVFYHIRLNAPNNYCYLPETLRSIIITDESRIDKYSFQGCSGLESITIGGNITSVALAFFDCSGLTSVTIPNSVTNIGGAFFGCSSLTSIDLPDGVTNLDGAFYGCASLTSIGIPNGAKSIGDSTFYDCSSLTSIIIPDGVTNIGAYAFYGCSGLSSITIPGSVTSIGYRAFSGCSELTAIDIPNTVTSIGKEAFDSCPLENIIVGNGVSTLQFLDLGSRYHSNTQLTRIAIGRGVTNLDASTFWYCSGLKALYLPNSYLGNPWVPSGCDIIRYDNLVRLDVESAVGMPDPFGLLVPCASNAVVSCSVPSPFESDGLRYTCTGWRGTGSVPADGTSNSVNAQMIENSSITWLWGETNVWIECAVSGDATLSCAGEGWFPKDGAEATFSFVPFMRPFGFVLSGDADGVSVDEEGGTIAIPTDRPRAIGLHVPSYDEAVEAGGKQISWAEVSTWFVKADETVSNGFCLQSGAVAQGDSSVLEAIVTGPGRLSFKWRIDAPQGDYARLYVDDVNRAEISQAPVWRTNEVNMAEGEHTIRWEFSHGSLSTNAAACLDEVRWTPRHTLVVSSTDGTPTPASGSHDIYWGEEVFASVVAPATVGGTRRACTGWTGAGSVPSSGTETSVAFKVEEDSAITWNWRTEHWVDVAIVSGGTTLFQPQWSVEGTTLTVSLSPNWTLYDIALSGDTAGVTVSGATLSIPVDGPRTIRATITERKVFLTVSTPMGTVTPAPGVYAHSYGDTVRVRATSPVSEVDGEQIVCSGWTGTGSVSSGSGVSKSFSIRQDSSILWNWETNVWIDVTVEGDGVTSFVPQWIRKGTDTMIALTPATDRCMISLSGDVMDGVTLDGTTLWVMADKPRTIIVTIQRKCELVVSSEFGTSSPAAGIYIHSWGDTVSANVSEPSAEEGIRHTCIGWTGKGSVPESGMGTNVAFTIEEDSSVSWLWRTDYWLALEKESDVETTFTNGWVQAGGTLAIAYNVDVASTVVIGGDTNGVLVDKASHTITVPCDIPRLISLAVVPDLQPVITETTPSTKSVRLDPYEWYDIFYVEAYDPNGESLSFTWYINGVNNLLDAWGDGNRSGLETLLDPGTYVIQCVVSDGRHSVSREWAVEAAWIPQTIYVDASSAATYPDGKTPDTAFRAISDAMSNCRYRAGDIVLVAPGRYVPGDIWFQPPEGANIHIASTHGPEETILDFEFDYNHSHIGGFRRLDGFTITRCMSIQGDGPESVVENCIITNCLPECNPLVVSGTVRNCLLADGQYSCDRIVYQAAVQNCTVITHPNGRTAELCSFVNSILWDSSAASASSVGFTTRFPDCSFTNCLVKGLSDAVVGLGNIDTDPLFVNSESDDYRLQSSSPCIDAGLAGIAVWTNDLAGFARISGRAVDLGAYEFQFSPPETKTTPVPVPLEWMDAFSAMVEEYHGNYEAFGNATASNGVNKVWECYVAGLDPTSATNQFRAEIVFDENGAPKVEWTPDLGSARDYIVEGKESLSDGWGPTNVNSRFFRVKVSMPE